jgi:hypothetical protein
MSSVEDRADYGLVEKLEARALWDESRPDPGDRFRWLFRGEHGDVPASFIGTYEDPDPERLGICCSGGGIRSASFNLGALQAMQDAQRLQKAKYLAAVSGGSYIAAAFSMVACTKHPDVDDSDPRLVTELRPPFYEGSPEEQYLRNRLSYLVPSGVGKLVIVWRVACGLFINLVLIASVLTLVAAVLALYYRHHQPGLIVSPHRSTKVDLSPIGLGLAAGLALAGIVSGMAAALLRGLSDRTQNLAQTLSLYLLAAGALVFCVEVLFPELIVVLQPGGRGAASAPRVSGNRGAVFGGGIGATVASIFAAVLVQIRARVADPKKAIEAAKEAEGWLNKLTPRLRQIVVNVATTVSGPLLLLGLLIGLTLVQVDPPRSFWLRAIPLIAGVVFSTLYFLGDLTSWSLHPLYRRRLCTAFALKRVPNPRVAADHRGRAVERQQSKLPPLSETDVLPHHEEWKDRQWPTLLVCAAANISDPGATPPGRGVTSFTFSPFAVGGPLVGGIATREFEDKLSEGLRRDFTLPAAVAMSGAAVSPSMGKMTRPSLRFLMALANVRLGVWVANPRRLDSFVRTHVTSVKSASGAKETMKALLTPVHSMGDEQVQQVREQAPPRSGLLLRPPPRYLLKELLGWNSVNDKYLYITDGGHYENLGLVELLRRGCMQIYCFDASGGRSMGALGDAIALARTEVGVEIEFAEGELDDVLEQGPDGAPKFASECCAVGTIRYPGIAKEGRLVYTPSVMTTDLPWDVLAYRDVDADFPHDSTIEQLFTDQRFEAYRVLGRHAGEQAMEAMDSV